MNVAPSTYISLFAGTGGLDLSIRIACPDARCIGYVEIGAEAAEVLATRIEEGSLDEAPVWSDVRTFPGELYRGRVAGIVAGFPCPDYSVAGKRAGIVGKHGQLWDYLAAVIRDVGPDWVLLENVPGIYVPHGGDAGAVLPAGLWFVLGDLASLGFDAEWLCLRASDVGASHGRARWFCLAQRKGGILGILREPSGSDRFTDGRNEELAHASRHERNGSGRKTGARRERGHSTDERSTGAAGDSELADTGCERDERRREPGELAGPSGSAETGAQERERRGNAAGNRYTELPLFAPGPSDPRWPAILRDFPELAPALSEEEIEQLIHCLDDGMARTLAGSRTDQLRACGNGVVSVQGAAAFILLARRILNR